MAITGSGKFVAIAASSTILDNIFSDSISGLTLGVDDVQYVRLSERYITQSGVVTGSALAIDPKHSSGRLCIKLSASRIVFKDEYDRDKAAYTGKIDVATDCTVNSVTSVTTNYATYWFSKGLLMNVFRT